MCGGCACGALFVKKRSSFRDALFARTPESRGDSLRLDSGFARDARGRPGMTELCGRRSLPSPELFEHVGGGKAVRRRADRGLKTAQRLAGHAAELTVR